MKTKVAQERRLSFTSVNIMAGCMPEHVNLDNPTICVTLTLKETPNIANVTDVVKKFLTYDRLNSVPKQTGKKPKQWNFERLDDVIDPRKMIRVVDISCDTKEEWGEAIQVHRNLCLRKDDLPWWEFVIMNNEGKSDHLLIFRIDHAIADGLSIGKLFTNVIKRGDGSTITSLIPSSMVSNKEKSRKNYFSMLMKLPKAIFDVATSPLGRVDDPTKFSENLVGTDLIDKRDQDLFIFPPVPITFIKKIKDKAGVSFNDVLLATWAQAVEEYCQMHDCPVLKSKKKKILFRAMMTYGFPNNNDETNNAVGNRWIPLPLHLPIGMKTASEKLKSISSSSNHLKSSPMPLVQLLLQNVILAILPIALTRHIVHKVYSKMSLTVTNVPGPSEKVSIADQPIESLMFHVNHIHPVLSMISYDGNIQTTLCISRSALDDGHLLAGCFVKALVTIGNELKIEVPNSIVKQTLKDN